MAWKRPDPEPNDYSATPSRPATPTPTPPRSDRAVVGPSITIQGDLSGEEDLTILGRVEGTVDVKGNSVTIGSSGMVKADVYGKVIVVEGEVNGNLYGGDQIVLRASGKVRGNLTAPRVALDDGAQFKGSIEMEPKRESAPAGAQRPISKPAAASAPSSASSSAPSGGSSGAGAGGDRDAAAKQPVGSSAGQASR